MARKKLFTLVLLFTLLLPVATGYAQSQPPGSLDVSFSGNGRHIQSLTPVLDQDQIGRYLVTPDLVVQPDGKFLIATTQAYSSGDLALLRYLPNGDLDLEFHRDGWVVSDPTGARDFSETVLLQPDGKIIQVANTAILRYNANGYPDPTFAGDGVVEIQNGSAMEGALLPNGKIVIAGLGVQGSQTGRFLARYNPDGSLDATFGTGGSVLDRYSAGEIIHVITDMAIATDGKLVLVGYFDNGSRHWWLAVRYKADGSLDRLFDIPYQWLDPECNHLCEDHATAVEIQPDGKIVVAGGVTNLGLYTWETQYQNFLTIRYNPDGSVDPGFGENGSTALDFGPGEDYVNDLLLQPDGRIIVAGNSNGDFALVRYSQHGTLDQSFGDNGRKSTGFGGFEYATDLALQPDGRLLAAGVRYNGIPIARFFLGGNLQPAADISIWLPIMVRGE